MILDEVASLGAAGRTRRYRPPDERRAPADRGTCRSHADRVSAPCLALTPLPKSAEGAPTRHSRTMARRRNPVRREKAPRIGSNKCATPPCPSRLERAPLRSGSTELQDETSMNPVMARGLHAMPDTLMSCLSPLSMTLQQRCRSSQAAQPGYQPATGARAGAGGAVAPRGGADPRPVGAGSGQGQASPEFADLRHGRTAHCQCLPALRHPRRLHQTHRLAD